jgi:hypothetical protein
MLVPAISRKDELEKLFAAHIYDNSMFLFGHTFDFENEFSTNNIYNGEYQWAIVDKDDKVIGYFRYHVDMINDTVNRFKLITFKTDSITGIDVYKMMKKLIKTHHRIEWQMVEGNPVKPHYDRFCKRYNGKRFKLHNVIKDPYGYYHDMYIYEILRSKVVKKKKKKGTIKNKNNTSRLYRYGHWGTDSESIDTKNEITTRCENIKKYVIDPCSAAVLDLKRMRYIITEITKQIAGFAGFDFDDTPEYIIKKIWDLSTQYGIRDDILLEYLSGIPVSVLASKYEYTAYAMETRIKYEYNVFVILAFLRGIRWEKKNIQYVDLHIFFYIRALSRREFNILYSNGIHTWRDLEIRMANNPEYLSTLKGIGQQRKSKILNFVNGIYRTEDFTK